MPPRRNPRPWLAWPTSREDGLRSSGPEGGGGALAQPGVQVAVAPAVDRHLEDAESGRALREGRDELVTGRDVLVPDVVRGAQSGQVGARRGAEESLELGCPRGLTLIRAK